MTVSKALFIMRNGSVGGLRKYFEAMEVIEGEINRQKAEIERLQSHIQEGVDLAKQLPEALKLSQNAAIKWFAERLVSKAKSTKERFLLESLVESVKKEMGCNDESKT